MNSKLIKWLFKQRILITKPLSRKARLSLPIVIYPILWIIISQLDFFKVYDFKSVGLIGLGGLPIVACTLAILAEYLAIFYKLRNIDLLDVAFTFVHSGESYKLLVPKNMRVKDFLTDYTSYHINNHSDGEFKLRMTKDNAELTLGKEVEKGKQVEEYDINKTFAENGIKDNISIRVEIRLPEVFLPKEKATKQNLGMDFSSTENRVNQSLNLTQNPFALLKEQEENEKLDNYLEGLEQINEKRREIRILKQTFEKCKELNFKEEQLVEFKKLIDDKTTELAFDLDKLRVGTLKSPTIIKSKINIPDYLNIHKPIHNGFKNFKSVKSVESVNAKKDKVCFLTKFIKSMFQRSIVLIEYVFNIYSKKIEKFIYAQKLK